MNCIGIFGYHTTTCWKARERVLEDFLWSLDRQLEQLESQQTNIRTWREPRELAASQIGAQIHATRTTMRVLHEQLVGISA